MQNRMSGCCVYQRITYAKKWAINSIQNANFFQKLMQVFGKLRACQNGECLSDPGKNTRSMHSAYSKRSL